MKIQDQKKIIRKEIRKLKKDLSLEEKMLLSELVLKNVEKDISFINSKTILAYWSMKDEVNTHSFIIKWSKSKDIYLPVVIGNDLGFRKYSDESELKKDSKFGIYEPLGAKLNDYSLIDYAIIPGVAFDSNNNRLGRGRAFYDKILNSINAIKVGICFNFQFIESVPTEPTDIKMDRVINETEHQ